MDGDALTITREIDGGLQTLRMNAPAVITVDLRLNEPRYAKLPDMMKAKKKPIAAFTPDDFTADISPRYEIVRVSEPPAREAGVTVKTVDELVDKLKNEAKVI
jgi:electron transfer flavoprotein beta subunit